jgi:hypothetical protein
VALRGIVLCIQPRVKGLDITGMLNLRDCDGQFFFIGYLVISHEKRVDGGASKSETARIDHRGERQVQGLPVMSVSPETRHMADTRHYSRSYLASL